MKNLYIIFLLFILCCGVNAQSKFYKNYSISQNIYTALEKTPDGGFAAIGSKTQWLFKYDNCGNFQWGKYIPLGTFDLTICKNGDFLLSSAWDSPPELLRLDSDGNLKWRYTYTTSAMSVYRYHVFSCGEFPNGDLFFNGLIEAQPSGNQRYTFIIKTDSAGTIKWSNWYNPQACCWGMAIPCTDGGVLSMATGAIKTDSSGNVEWATSNSSTYKPVELNDGFVFAAYKNISGVNVGFIYKTDKQGTLLWVGDSFKGNFFSKISRLPNGHFLILGNLAIDSTLPSFRFIPVIVETDSLGKFISQKTFTPNVPAANSYLAGALCVLDDKSVVISGRESNITLSNSNHKFFLSKMGKMNFLGCGDSSILTYYAPPALSIYSFNPPFTATNINFTRQAVPTTIYDMTAGEQVYCNGYDSLQFKFPHYVCIQSGGDTLLAGPQGYSYIWSTGDTSEAITVSSPGTYSLIVVDRCANDTIRTTIDVLLCSDGSTGIGNIFFEAVHISPNPSSGIFTVQMHNCQAGARVIVRDVLGNCLLERNCRGETSQEINLSCQPRGIYFVEVLSGTERRTEKIIIE